VAQYTGRFGRLRPRAYVVHGLMVVWKLHLDAYVQQGPHFSTQGKNDSWQKVIFRVGDSRSPASLRIYMSTFQTSEASWPASKAAQSV